MKLVRFHDTNFDDEFQILMEMGLYETAVIQYAEENTMDKIFLMPEEWDLLYENEIMSRPIPSQLRRLIMETS